MASISSNPGARRQSARLLPPPPDILKLVALIRDAPPTHGSAEDEKACVDEASSSVAAMKEQVQCIRCASENRGRLQ